MKKTILSALLIAPALVACGADKIVTVDPLGLGTPVEINCTKGTYMEPSQELYSTHRTPEGHVKYAVDTYGAGSAEAFGAQFGSGIITGVINNACK